MTAQISPLYILEIFCWLDLPYSILQIHKRREKHYYSEANGNIGLRFFASETYLMSPINTIRTINHI